MTFNWIMWLFQHLPQDDLDISPVYYYLVWKCQENVYGFSITKVTFFVIMIRKGGAKIILKWIWFICKMKLKKTTFDYHS